MCCTKDFYTISFLIRTSRSDQQHIKLLKTLLFCRKHNSLSLTDFSQPENEKHEVDEMLKVKCGKELSLKELISVNFHVSYFNVLSSGS